MTTPIIARLDEIAARKSHAVKTEYERKGYESEIAHRIGRGCGDSRIRIICEQALAALPEEECDAILRAFEKESEVRVA